jgi:hypothetical protein
VVQLIAEARTITSLDRDPDLIEKITVLQEYVEFSTMFPDRDYGPVIRTGSAELRAILDSMLRADEITAKDRAKASRVFKPRELCD